MGLGQICPFPHLDSGNNKHAELMGQVRGSRELVHGKCLGQGWALADDQQGVVVEPDDVTVVIMPLMPTGGTCCTVLLGLVLSLLIFI